MRPPEHTLYAPGCLGLRGHGRGCGESGGEGVRMGTGNALKRGFFSLKHQEYPHYAAQGSGIAWCMLPSQTPQSPNGRPEASPGTCGFRPAAGRRRRAYSLHREAKHVAASTRIFASQPPLPPRKAIESPGGSIKTLPLPIEALKDNYPVVSPPHWHRISFLIGGLRPPFVTRASYYLPG